MVASLIPVYNVLPLLPGVLRASASLPDVLVIDDGSTDGTKEMLAGAQIPTITHPENLGKGTALITGFRALLARPEVTGILTLDGDGQHDVADAPRFFAAHASHPDALLVGNRWHGEQRAPMIRMFANGFSSMLVRKFSGERVVDSQCGYRLYPRSFLARVLPGLKDGRFETETLLLLLAGRLHVPIQNIPIATMYSSETMRLSKYRAVVDSYRIARTLLQSLRHPVDHD